MPPDVPQLPEVMTGKNPAYTPEAGSSSSVRVRSSGASRNPCTRAGRTAGLEHVLGRHLDAPPRALLVGDGLEIFEAAGAGLDGEGSRRGVRELTDAAIGQPGYAADQRRG